MNVYRKIGLQIFKWLYRHVGQKTRNGLKKIPLVWKVYRFLYLRLAPSEAVAWVNTAGGKMCIDISSGHRSGWMRLATGVWEEYETCLFKSALSEGMTVVDLGAYVGAYTLLAAKLVGDKGKVFAFEPVPYNFALLVRNIEANGYHNVIPVQKAISSRNGKTKLFLRQPGEGSNTIFDSYNASESIVVDVTTLDAFWESEGCPPVDVIKMDIEGAEPAALEGMSKIISENDNLKIMTEFAPEMLQRSGFTPIGFLEKLIQYGFKLYAITSQQPWMKPIDVPQAMKMCEKKEYINLFCQK